MNKLLLLLILALSSTVFAQTKTVIITQVVKTVPAGKKWILEINKPVKIQVNEGVFVSGSFCNAMILSNPRMIYNINRGDIYQSEGYGIIFKNLEKVPYTNNLTFSITPISFVDKNFSLSKLQSTSVEKVGTNKLEFYAGETVFIANCIQSIEFTELSMTQQDILIQNNIKNAQKSKENYISENFNIPINTQKYVVPGSKPEIHDKELSSIAFKSNAVLWTQPNKGSSVDESEWTLTLTPNIFKMESMNFEKKFKVIGAKYDDAFQSQRFELADDNNVHTFDLLLSYNKSSKYYSAIVTSIDHKEEYQFQEVVDTEKIFQNFTNDTTAKRNIENFNIPDYNSYYEKGGTPVYKFQDINQINFSCNNLLSVINGKYYKNNSMITISISPTEIVIQNEQNVITQKYKVIDIQFSEEFRSELFKLSKDGQNSPFNLILYYSSLDDNYTVIIDSKDGKEKFQFTKLHVKTN